MKKNKSTNFFYINVDTELVVRNMVFFVFFVLLLGIFIDNFLFPVVEQYKNQILEEKKEKIVLAQVQKDFEVAQSILIRTKKANDRILNTMSHDFSRDRFKNSLSKYFSNVRVDKKSSQKSLENQIQDDVYFVQGESRDLENLNKFFTDLEMASVSVKILLPIIVTKSVNSDKLVLEFYLNVEKSNYKPEVTM